MPFFKKKEKQKDVATTKYSVEAHKADEIFDNPLGIYNSRVLTQLSGLKNRNTLFCTKKQDDVDAMIGVIMQSVVRGESIIILDTDNLIYNKTYALLKNNSYHVKTFDIDDDDSNTWSIFGNLTEKNEYIRKANIVVQTMKSEYLTPQKASNTDYVAEVTIILSALLAYAVAYSLLSSNKFEYLYNLINENTNENLDRIFEAAPDTPKSLWFDYKGERFEEEIDDVLNILDALRKDYTNRMLNDNDINMETPCVRKTAYFFNFYPDSKEDENLSLNIILNTTLYRFKKHQDQAKTDFEIKNLKINYFIANPEQILGLEYFYDELLKTSQSNAYNISTFFICSDVRAFFDEYQERAKSLINNMQYIVITSQSEISEGTTKALLSLSESFPYIEQKNNEQIIVCNGEVMKCKTYDIRTHTMYKKLRFTN